MTQPDWNEMLAQSPLRDVCSRDVCDTISPGQDIEGQEEDISPWKKTSKVIANALQVKASEFRWETLDGKRIAYSIANGKYPAGGIQTFKALLLLGWLADDTWRKQAGDFVKEVFT